MLLDELHGRLADLSLALTLRRLSRGMFVAARRLHEGRRRGFRRRGLVDSRRQFFRWEGAAR